MKKPAKIKKSSIIKSLEKKIIPILKKNGVTKAGIFGSYARGDYNKKSDVDILIQVKRRKFSLFDLVGIELELEKELRKKVDLLTYRGINKHLKKYILEDEVKII
ncbi:TPA: hypothetical protein HA246_03910 [Candidatus Woesearchaeota archaeon]|nr:hypothetical protein [Candidatus Woesearchaeota archaeon]